MARKIKIISWNVNGLRSAARQGFIKWLAQEPADIICLQEIKANVLDLPSELVKINGYYSYFNSAQKKGYSGTAVYTKVQPKIFETSILPGRFDGEGRGIKMVFDEFTLYNFYIPNGSRDKRDMPYKLDTYAKLLGMFASQKNQNIILAGDFNIAHKEIDVFNAKHNKNNTMFTPGEREQIDKLIGLGFIDAFREQNPQKQCFSWWPYMANLRERDIGWRIDYIFTSKKLFPKVKNSSIKKEVLGSDHCPVMVELGR